MALLFTHHSIRVKGAAPHFYAINFTTMYSWINSQGETVKTKTIKEFAQLTGMRESNCRRLACGAVAKSHGWCSTKRRAARLRKRFTTVLQNMSTGETAIVGQSVASFCRSRKLSTKNLHGVLCGKRIAYKNWTLAKSLELIASASHPTPNTHFQHKATTPHPKFSDAVVGL